MDSPVLYGTYDGPRVFFGASPASYHSLIGGPLHGQRHMSTAEEIAQQIFGLDEVDHDSYATPPGPTQDTQEPLPPPYDLRSDPRSHHTYTFPSGHMAPPKKRGRGR